jgi:hypothetical protein
MLRAKAAILGAALLASGAAPGAAPRHHPAEAAPPDPYAVDGFVTDAMNFPWTAKRRLPVYAEPGSRKRVAMLSPGEIVVADRLQLRGRPWAVRVIYDRKPFRTGMRMWILERDLDEGSFMIWYRGERREDLADAMTLGPSEERCGPPSEYCYLRFAKEPRQESWFRVTTRGGLVGWTPSADDFLVGKIRNGAAASP